MVALPFIDRVIYHKQPMKHNHTHSPHKHLLSSRTSRLIAHI